MSLTDAINTVSRQPSKRRQEPRGSLDMWKSLLPNAVPPEKMLARLPEILAVAKAIHGCCPAPLSICATAVLGSINAAVEGRYALGYRKTDRLSANRFFRLGINFAVGDMIGCGKTSARDCACGDVVPSRRHSMAEMADWPGDWHAALEFNAEWHPSVLQKRGVPILLTIDNKGHASGPSKEDAAIIARHHERLERIIGSNQPSGINIVRMDWPGGSREYDLRSISMRLAATLAIYSNPDVDVFGEHYTTEAAKIVKAMAPKWKKIGRLTQ